VQNTAQHGMNLSIVLYIGAIMCIPRGYGPIIAENGIIVHYVISAVPYYRGKSAERSKVLSHILMGLLKEAPPRQNPSS
jgi:hypothetical protein